MREMIEKIEGAVHCLRERKPVILNLTNVVTMDFMANCLLALGAAPIMSVFQSEMEELVALCSAININIGTLDQSFIERTEAILALAQKYHKPIVFDPVGAGATQIRTAISQKLLPHAAIIRGNASEIIALGGAVSRTKGVESVHSTDDAKQVALDLALQYKSTVMVSGPVDFITDGGARQLQVPYGTSLMSLVTGMGCALTAVIAAFRAVNDDSFEAGTIAAHYFAICGEQAAKNTPHPGTFRMHFIDRLHAADYKSIRAMHEV